MSWTDERIALLKKMWKDGKSAAEIAKTLGKGVTRNAVIGKAHRMGLSGRPSPIKKPTATAKKEPAKKEAPARKEILARKEVKPGAAPLKKSVATPVVSGVKNNPLLKEMAAQQQQQPKTPVKEIPPLNGGTALIDLSERMCKWPYGDPQEDDFTFCGRGIRPGTPYCPDHAAMAYQTSSRGRTAPVFEEKVVEESVDDDDTGVA